MYRGVVGSEPGKLRAAFLDATAEGVRRYLPAGVGILARGIPALALAALAHVLLDISAQVSVGSGLAGTGLHEILVRLAHRS